MSQVILKVFTVLYSTEEKTTIASGEKATKPLPTSFQLKNTRFPLSTTANHNNPTETFLFAFQT
jgi:hypothetical protein